MAWASEADLEAVFMEDLGALGYSLHHGSEISPVMRNPMRTSFRETFLLSVFFESLKRLNPELPDTAIQIDLNAFWSPWCLFREMGSFLKLRECFSSSSEIER